MSGFKSGLSYEKLRAAADANALDTLTSGAYQKNGKRYQAKVSYLDKRGERQKRMYLIKTLDGTLNSGRDATGKRELQTLVSDWVSAVVSDIRAVGRLDADPSMTTRTALEWFIDSKDVRDENGEPIGARASTLTFYRSCAKRIEMSPAIASKPIGDVTKQDVDGWVRTMAAKLAEKSVKDSLNLLSQTCKSVLGADANPCKDVTVPKNVRKGKRSRYTKGKPNALSADGVGLLNRFLDEREANYEGPDNMVVGVRIALHSGMRAEEVSGLRWRDVDFTNRCIYVVNVIERAEIPVLDENGNKTYSDSGRIVTAYKEFDAVPKTEGSIRSIPMGEELARTLIAHKRRMMGILGSGKGIEDMYVIGTPDRPYSPHRLGVNFRKFCRTRNIIGTEGDVVGFHDLRHSFASLSISNGMPISEVSAILGHSKVSTTLDIYVGSDEKERRKVIDEMADIFSARTPESVDILRPTGTEG